MPKQVRIAPIGASSAYRIHTRNFVRGYRRAVSLGRYSILDLCINDRAGTQLFRAFWFPACAGMTTVAAFVFKSGSDSEHFR
jgi:hypothetical protein